MSTERTLLVILDLTGTFAFSLNGALTALRVVHLDIVGVVTLGMITGLGGGILRDLMLDALPPANFTDWRYLAVAAGGGLATFFLARWLERGANLVLIFDAAGLGLFAVTGAAKALEFGLGPAQAIILGAVTGAGGGTLRDILIRRVPTVLTSELYAVSALVAAAITVGASHLGVRGTVVTVGAAAVCFAIRMLGLRYNINAPGPKRSGPDNDGG
ncbi:MAG: trimeric intracellular cation channel family protein [Actinocatenispora sp.]